MKIVNVNRFIFIILISLTGITYASSWHWVGESVEGRSFIDKESIVISGHIRKAWVSEVLHKEKYLPVGSKKAFLSTNSLLVFNCNNRTAALLQVTYYSKAYREGEIIDTSIINKEQIKFNDIPPDSVSEEWLKFVCSN